MYYLVTGSGRVRVRAGFYQKPGPDPNPLRFFFFKNPNPTLFFIGPGKIRPIRVGPDQVSAGRAIIAIPNPTKGMADVKLSKETKFRIRAA